MVLAFIRYWLHCEILPDGHKTSWTEIFKIQRCGNKVREVQHDEWKLLKGTFIPNESIKPRFKKDKLDRLVDNRRNKYKKEYS